MAPRKKIQTTQQTEKQIPDAVQAVKDQPDAKQENKKLPASEMKMRELPPVMNPQNTVIIGGQIVEIKPTKLKYQRNRTASFYHILDLYPLSDILAMEAGQFGDDRDGDKALMDWLIAITDNEQLIVQNYDEMDTQIVDKLVEIYKRVNRVTEKENKLKNLARTQETE